MTQLTKSRIPLNLGVRRYVVLSIENYFHPKERAPEKYLIVSLLFLLMLLGFKRFQSGSV